MLPAAITARMRRHPEHTLTYVLMVVYVSVRVYVRAYGRNVVLTLCNDDGKQKK